VTSGDGNQPTNAREKTSVIRRRLLRPRTV